MCGVSHLPVGASKEDIGALVRSSYSRLEPPRQAGESLLAFRTFGSARRFKRAVEESGADDRALEFDRFGIDGPSPRTFGLSLFLRLIVDGAMTRAVMIVRGRGWPALTGSSTTIPGLLSPKQCPLADEISKCDPFPAVGRPPLRNFRLRLPGDAVPSHLRVEHGYRYGTDLRWAARKARSRHLEFA